jgi:hypothetical protein
MRLAQKRVRWPRTHRLITSQVPPVGPFDGLVDDDPVDAWIAADLEVRSNPRLAADGWHLSRIPPHRMVSGPGSAYLLAPFTKLPLMPSRFSDGSYGVYYTADSLETAVAEVVFHVTRLRRASASPAQDFTFRELVGSLDAILDDIEAQPPDAVAASLDPDPEHYAAAQGLAAVLRADGSDGIAYPSVRRAEGACAALFYPNLMLPPMQGHHPQMRWNGSRVTHWRLEGAKEWTPL